MPTSSYTFKVTIAGADAITQAKLVRRAIEAEFKGVSLDISKLPEAQRALEELKKSASGVGRALTAGFRAQTAKLLEQVVALQTEVNQVVRAGASPVQEALAELGAAGYEAAGLIDAGSKEATQAMARLTTQIQGTRAEIKTLQEHMAELATYPIVPAGAPGEVSNLGKLFHDMTHTRIQDVRRLARETARELGPVREELQKQAEAAKAEAAPAFDRLTQELAELQAAQRALLEQRAEVGRWSDDYQRLTADLDKYTKAVIQAEKEAEQLRSVAMGTAQSEALRNLILQEQQHMAQLQEKTIWWKELVQGGGDYASIIEHVAKTSGKEAADQLATMVAHHQRIKQLAEAEARAIGRMEKLQTKVLLPPGAEGSLAMLVVAERDLGESAKIAGDHLDTQAKALRKLTTQLDLAAQAAQGFDRTQREAIQRLQMVTEKQIRQATRVSLGLTPGEAGAAVVPILAQLDAQVEAIKSRSLERLDEIEQEGQRRQPFTWLVTAAQKVRQMLVGESIIPELVQSINEWLLQIGIQDPFTRLAADADKAASAIQSGLQMCLKALSTTEAQQELKRLTEAIEETGLAIEKQLVRTGEASQEYKRAFAEQAAEIRRVRGDDPTVMAMLARGELPKGVGIRGEFRTMEIIDEGYRALRTEVEDRQRLTQEETEKLLELERQHTSLRLRASALERELAARQVAALEKAMAAALDVDQDVDAFESLNRQYIEAQERLGDISQDILLQREMITSEATAQLERELEESKAMARRTIQPGAGVEVGGEVIMPRISQTQVKNALEYAKAMEEVAKALKQVPTKQYQEALLALQKMLTEMKEAAPTITAEEQKRLVATARAVAHASESQRRLTAQFQEEEKRKTEVHAGAVRAREIAIEKSAVVVVELAKRKSQQQQEQEKRLSAVTKSEAAGRAAVEKQQARAAATEVIEGERRLTAQLKEEERRRTLDHQDELRQRARAEREMQRARLQPTAADIEYYGGGRIGAVAWAAWEAQRRQMGLRSLTYDMRYFGRAAMLASAAMTGPPVLAMRRFVDYTRQTDRSARAMGLAREESDALRHALIEQSVALGMIKPEDMASGFHLWVTGVGAAASSMEELQKVIADTIPIQQMAYMQQISLAEGTEAVAGTLAEYSLPLSDTEKVVALLDATADQTFATVSDLGEAFKMVGPIANQLEVSIEETAAAFGLLSNANIKGTMAGRAMRQLFIRLSSTTNEEGEALNKLFHCSEALGQSWRDLAFPEGQFIGLAKWVDLLAASTADLTQEERAAALATIATATELPALTYFVELQIAARERGINVLRAEVKKRSGILDAEVLAYAQWEKETTGNIISLESAHESFARKVKETTESESYQIDQMRAKWDAAMLSLGESTMIAAMPALEELSEIVGDLAEFIAENPWVAQAMLAAGGVLGAVGILATTAATLMRAMTIARTISTAIQGWGAAQHVLAADTQVVAANTQMAAAELQTTSRTTFLGGLGKVVATLLAVTGGFEIGRRISEEVRGEEIPPGQALGEIGTFVGQLAAMTAGTGGMLMAWLLGEDPAEGFEIATYEAGKLFGLIQDEGQLAAEDTADVLKDWNVELERARRQAQGLGSDLMQLPGAAAGLAAFTEAELEAIDELESYLRDRNELIEKHNDELADMEQDFLEKEADYYQDYLDQRADLEEELREVAQDPLWQMTRDVQKSEERISEAIEEYNKRIAEAIEEHQRKLRNLQEDHDDKMEDLEAQRDAKGIIAERRRYGRAMRDANEHHQDLLDDTKERLNETIETEREKITTLRQERKEDLEEKLRELDENYFKESQKRKEAHEKAYADRQQAQARELQQLEQAHAERLARIMEWETRVRDALRQGYVGREADLRAHLGQMERMYLDTYGMISQLSPEAMTAEEYRAWHEQVRGHQMGGYASSGMYRLGEAGSEYVLSAPTTRALERAIGHLNQAKILSMAGGGTSSHLRLDVHVTADDHFSPAFAAQTEAIVRKEVVALSVKATRSQPGAYRPH